MHSPSLQAFFITDLKKSQYRSVFLTRNFPFIVGTFTCKCSRVSSDSFENIGIDGKVIPPPPTFALNKNNKPSTESNFRGVSNK